MITGFCIIYVIYNGCCGLRNTRWQATGWKSVVYRICGGMAPLVLILGSSRRRVFNITSLRVKLQKSSSNPLLTPKVRTARSGKVKRLASAGIRNSDLPAQMWSRCIALHFLSPQP